MTYYQHDPALYSVGATIYVRSRSTGWGVSSAAAYVVSKITPSGQITASNGSREIRITAKGNVVGDDRSKVIGKAEADELLAEAAINRLWIAIRNGTDRIEQGARGHDRKKVEEGLAQVQAALSRLTGPSA